MPNNKKKSVKKKPAKKIIKKSPVKKMQPKKTAAVKKYKPAARLRKHPVCAHPQKILRVFRISLFTFLSAVVFSLLFVIHSLFIKSAMPNDMSYTIGQGATVSGVARDLDQGAAYKFFIRMFGNKVMAGTYDLPAGASVYELARMTAKGEIASTEVMIPEGLTVLQIANTLNGNRHLTGKISNHYKDGELFPDTYVVPKGMSRQAVLDLMAKKMETVRADFLGARMPDPIQDWNEVITLASIVQKETSLVREMPKVASVYLNRLRKNMRLQADPTVVYVITNKLGDMQERRLYSKHLKVASPYNTYRNRGLPPAPIANVGMDAIRAVLSPSRTDYYFFVADGTGGHVFSETLDEHNRNREAWREIRKNGKK